MTAHLQRDRPHAAVAAQLIEAGGRFLATWMTGASSDVRPDELDGYSSADFFAGIESGPCTPPRRPGWSDDARPLDRIMPLPAFFSAERGLLTSGTLASVSLPHRTMPAARRLW